MKTYVELINVVLNDNYAEGKGFNSLKLAIEYYEKIKKIWFDETAKETIYESKEREIIDDENTLKLYFITKTVPDDWFEMLHPASIADI